jgi:HNH endonuclease
MMEEVDHIIPLVDGGPRLDMDNLQSLCWQCHKAWKRRLEAFARLTDQVLMLLDWCKKPETRPHKFSIRS